MSNVKSITRPKSGHSHQSSESSESSIDSIPTLAGKVAKILSEEDAKNKFDAATNVMESPVNKGKKMKESSKSDPLLHYFNVEVCNRYGVLADKSVEMDVQEEEQPQPSTSTAQESQQQQKRSGTNNAKPPALCFVSRMRERLREFKQLLNSVSTAYYVQFSGENTLVYFKKLDDYRRFVERYSNEVPFYTYTPRAEKTLAFLIKGLHYECECEDIKNELLELNISVKSVVKFKNTKHPIFMITVPKTVSIKQLQVQVSARRNTAPSCAEKQRKIKQNPQRKTEAQPRYVPAPLPTRNAWDRRDLPALPSKTDNNREREPASKNSRTRETVSAPRHANHAPRVRVTQSQSAANRRQPMPNVREVRETRDSSPRSTNETAKENGLGGLRYVNSISETLEDINNIVNLKWLSEKLLELKEAMSTCKTLILHWNCDGISTKVEELTTAARGEGIHVILLNELRITARFKLRIRGYVPYVLRNNNGHGGIAALIREDVPHRRVELRNVRLQNAEAVAVQLEDNTILVALYNSPQKWLLQNELEAFFALGRKVVLAGDFNTTHATWGCHRNNVNGNTLHRFINNNNTRTLPSDHAALEFSVNGVEAPARRVRLPDYSRANWQSFRAILNEVPIVSDIPDIETLDTLVAAVGAAIRKAADKTIPTETVDPYRYSELPIDVRNLIRYS
ncbi:hypothetical protein Trydic_g1808 [Trypoxylus dichotomus]